MDKNSNLIATSKVKKYLTIAIIVYVILFVVVAFIAVKYVLPIYLKAQTGGVL